MKRHSNNYLYNPLIGNFLSWFIAAIIMSFKINGYVDSPLYMIVGLFVGSFWTIWLHAFRDAYRMDIKHQSIPHKKWTVIRAAVAIFIGQAVHGLGFGFNFDSLIDGGAAAVFLWTIFWLEFDFFINHHRGKRLLYITDADDGASESDKLFNGHVFLWILSKILLFLGGIFLYYWALMTYF